MSFAVGSSKKVAIDEGEWHTAVELGHQRPVVLDTADGAVEDSFLAMEEAVLVSQVHMLSRLVYPLVIVL